MCCGEDESFGDDGSAAQVYALDQYVHVMGEIVWGTGDDVSDIFIGSWNFGEKRIFFFGKSWWKKNNKTTGYSCHIK